MVHVVMLVATALTASAVAVFVGVFAPAWIHRAFGFALGLLPFGHFPGIPLPMVLVLACASSAVVLLHASLNPPPTLWRVAPLEWAMLALILTSLVSVIVTAETVMDAVQFAGWLIASALLFVLLRMSPSHLIALGRAFVLGSVGAALYGMADLILGPASSLGRILVPFGYPTSDTERYVFGTGGPTLRLAGTYTDPNAGALFLVVALAVGIAVFAGPARWILASILAVGMVATLSRAALFSVVVGAVVVALFRRLGGTERVVGVTLAVASIIGALSVPAVRSRLLDSFGSTDVGSSKRSDALDQFPRLLDGHWSFGLGWGRPEFLDAETAWRVNNVANSPLLTVYRGGLAAGTAFVVLGIVMVVVGYRVVRTGERKDAAIGAVAIGLVLVALQLDFPVVTIPAVTMVFTVLVAFLADANRPPPRTDGGMSGSCDRDRDRAPFHGVRTFA